MKCLSSVRTFKNSVTIAVARIIELIVGILNLLSKIGFHSMVQKIN